MLEGKVIIPRQFLLAIQWHLGWVRVRLGLLMVCHVRIWAGEALNLVRLSLVLSLGLMLVLGVVLGLVSREPVILKEVALLRLPLVGMGNRIWVVVQATTSRSAKG